MEKCSQFLKLSFSMLKVLIIVIASLLGIFLLTKSRVPTNPGDSGIIVFDIVTPSAYELLELFIPNLDIHFEVVLSNVNKTLSILAE